MADGDSEANNSEIEPFTVFENNENGEHTDAIDGVEDIATGGDETEEQSVDDPVRWTLNNIDVKNPSF